MAGEIKLCHPCVLDLDIWQQQEREAKHQLHREQIVLCRDECWATASLALACFADSTHSKHHAASALQLAFGIASRAWPRYCYEIHCGQFPLWRANPQDLLQRWFLLPTLSGSRQSDEQSHKDRLQTGGNDTNITLH